MATSTERATSAERVIEAIGRNSASSSDALFRTYKCEASSDALSLSHKCEVESGPKFHHYMQRYYRPGPICAYARL